MKEKHTFGDFLDDIVRDINSDIDLLGSNSCKNKWEVLKHLKDRISALSYAVSVINSNYDLQVQAVPNRNNITPMQINPPIVPPSAPPVNPPVPPAAPPPSAPSAPSKTFTADELAKNNGKKGNPAYVAVNGIVYDVTNNPAFAAGSHFGLSAGKDLTQEFIHCHEGRDILGKLIAIGKMA